MRGNNQGNRSVVRRQQSRRLSGASPKNLIYSEGRPDHKVANEEVLDDLERMIRDKVDAAVAADMLPDRLINESP